MTTLIEKGKKYGRLTVLSIEKRGKYYFAKCKCDCGTVCFRNVSHIKSGVSLSCGCIRKETTRILNRTHGMSGSRIDRCYKNMIRRCHNKNDEAYKYYGNRGVFVCEEWERSKQAFFDWAIANGYRDDLTIDRIDTNGPYAPWNCRWVSMKEQNRNRRSTILITYRGTTMCKKDWADTLGVPAYKFDSIFRECGMDGEKTIETIKKGKIKWQEK